MVVAHSMKISIITASYNSERFIGDCLRSVREQTYDCVEHVIIDNVSADRTLDAVRRDGRPGAIVISEPDRGIYDAMNKGLDRSSGDVIGFLNTDDYYRNPKVLEQVAGLFHASSADVVVGGISIISPDAHSEVRKWSTDSTNVLGFKFGWHPPHPAFFVRRRLFEQHGSFDLRFRIAADYELMLRFLMRYRSSAVHTPEVWVNMRAGGASNRSLISIIRGNIECFRAWKVNGLPIPASILLKPVSKWLHKTVKGGLRGSWSL